MNLPEDYNDAQDAATSPLEDAEGGTTAQHDLYNGFVDAALLAIEQQTGPFPVNLAAIPEAQLRLAASSLMALVFLCDEAALSYVELQGVMSRALQRWAFYVLSQQDNGLAEADIVKLVLALPDKNFLAKKEV